MGEKLICQNKKARFHYSIEDSLETGICLLGTEVKSLREGKVNLGDSYGTIKNGEVFLVDVHISPYSHGNRNNPDPLRTRKLLLHKQEIRRLIGKVQETGDSSSHREGSGEGLYAHPSPPLLFEWEGEG